MAVTARTWVEGEIATASKFNTIRDDILELDAVNGVKSVQYGTITIGNGSTSATASIAAVNVAKTILHFLGNTIESGSGVGDAFVRITLTSSTIVTATRASTGNIAIASFCAEERK